MIATVGWFYAAEACVYNAFGLDIHQGERETALLSLHKPTLRNRNTDQLSKCYISWSTYYDALMLADGIPTGEKGGDSFHLPRPRWALND